MKQRGRLISVNRILYSLVNEVCKHVLALPYAYYSVVMCQCEAFQTNYRISVLYCVTFKLRLRSKSSGHKSIKDGRTFKNFPYGYVFVLIFNFSEKNG